MLAYALAPYEGVHGHRMSRSANVGDTPTMNEQQKIELKEALENYIPECRTGPAWDRLVDAVLDITNPEPKAEGGAA